MLPPILSIIITLIIVIIALKIALKVTGCLVKLIILGVALWFILTVLNLGFNIIDLGSWI